MCQFNPLDLTNRNILITGASSGIGRETAVYLSKLGATIIASGRNNKKLSETFEMLEGKGHITVACDLSKIETIEILLQESVSKCGKLNGMVHCAGIPYVMPLNVLSYKHMEEAMKNNFYPFIELCRLYGKKKYSEGGSIVAISSILVEQPRANETAYIAAKGALSVAVGSLACDLAPKSIRVNGILCGNIMTDMVRYTVEKLNNEEQFKKNVSHALLGMGESEDIAAVAAFLISDMSRFITGRNIYADGGLM